VTSKNEFRRAKRGATPRFCAIASVRSTGESPRWLRQVGTGKTHPPLFSLALSGMQPIATATRFQSIIGDDIGYPAETTQRPRVAFSCPPILDQPSRAMRRRQAEIVSWLPRVAVSDRHAFVAACAWSLKLLRNDGGKITACRGLQPHAPTQGSATACHVVVIPVVRPVSISACGNALLSVASPFPPLLNHTQAVFVRPRTAGTSASGPAPRTTSLAWIPPAEPANAVGVQSRACEKPGPVAD